MFCVRFQGEILWKRNTKIIRNAIMRTFKTKPKSTKKIVFSLILILIAIVPIQAESKTQTLVLDWNPNKQKFTEKEIDLDELHLTSHESLLLDHFEIRSGMDSEAIRLDEAIGNKKIMTLVYHLTKANERLDWILHKSKSKPNIDKKKIIIRVDAPYAFSSSKYIDESTPLRNTAVTIPPSDFNTESEIWFGPKWSFPTISNFSTDRIIDTALCPDAIYHEFMHLYTGDYLGRNTIGRSLSEGISDYFAASFINFPELYSSGTCPGVRSQLFVRSFHIDGSIGMYDKEIESNFKRDFTFIPGLLWKIRNFVGSELADRAILLAVTRSSSTSRFYPEFINEFSKALYEEKKGISNESEAKSLIMNMEHNILNPHGLLTHFALDETIFANLPKVTQKFENLDERTKQICQVENRIEIYSNDFTIDDPYIRLNWICNGMKMPFIVDFDQNLPTAFQITNPTGYLTGTMRFVSLNPSMPPNRNLSMEDQNQYNRMYSFAKKNYFHYRTREREMRLYINRNDMNTRPVLRLEFAFPVFAGKGFSYHL